MRFIVGDFQGQRHVFITKAEMAAIVPIDAAVPEPDLTTLMGAPEPLAAAGDISDFNIPLAKIAPALPVNRPEKIICLGLNYVDHIKEGGYEIPTYPALFMRGRNTLVAAEEALICPWISDKFDYEAELMIVIGQGGRHIAENQALDHIFGYTLFNDGSVRDFQRKTHQWTPGKNFDNTGAVGPIVVTPDELPDGCHGLRIQSRINGKIMQDAITSDMLWSVAQTIATISEFATLEPGDLIATGTPPGVGHARTPPRFMRPGDIVEVEIEGIGVCRNPVEAEAPL